MALIFILLLHDAPLISFVVCYPCSMNQFLLSYSCFFCKFISETAMGCKIEAQTCVDSEYLQAVLS